MSAICRRELNMTTKDLLKAQMRIRILEDEVEKPMNVHRWRALEVRQCNHNLDPTQPTSEVTQPDPTQN